jgi:hypothetical protein
VLEIVAAFEKASGKVVDDHLALVWVLEIRVFAWCHMEVWTNSLIMFTLSQKIPLHFEGRRPGDSCAVYASTEKAEKELGWRW